MISYPVYVTFCPLYLWYLCSMHDITTLCVDNTTLSICMTTFALQKTSHPLYQTKSQSLWLHIHLRNDITPTVSDIAQLYLCHHNLSTDITSTCAWHHTHYICDSICTIYNILSTAYVLTLFYLWQQNLDIWNHIQYAAQNIHYPCDITVTSLCHHTHCIESITPTLCMTSHSA